MRLLLPLVVLASLTACAAPSSGSDTMRTEAGQAAIKYYAIRIGEPDRDEPLSCRGQLGIALPLDGRMERSASANFQAGLHPDEVIAMLREALVSGVDEEWSARVRVVGNPTGPDVLVVPAPVPFLGWQNVGPDDCLPSISIELVDGPDEV